LNAVLAVAVFFVVSVCVYALIYTSVHNRVPRFDDLPSTVRPLLTDVRSFFGFSSSPSSFSSSHARSIVYRVSDLFPALSPALKHTALNAMIEHGRRTQTTSFTSHTGRTGNGKQPFVLFIQSPKQAGAGNNHQLILDGKALAQAFASAFHGNTNVPLTIASLDAEPAHPSSSPVLFVSFSSPSTRPLPSPAILERWFSSHLASHPDGLIFIDGLEHVTRTLALILQRYLDDYTPSHPTAKFIFHRAGDNGEFERLLQPFREERAKPTSCCAETAFQGLTAERDTQQVRQQLTKQWAQQGKDEIIDALVIRVAKNVIYPVPLE